MKKLYLLALLLAIISGVSGQEITYKISGKYQNVPFTSFLSDVENQYPVRFFFSEDAIDSIFVNQNFRERSLEECLDLILENELVHYYKLDNQHFIIYSGIALENLFMQEETSPRLRSRALTPEEISKEKLKQKEYQIFNIGTPNKNRARTATVSGYLKTFETGDPVIGANIYILETNTGVSSNKYGFYSLTLPKGNQTINFSCIGMEPTKRMINLYSDGRLNVEMITQVNVIEDVNVYGGGESKLERTQMGVEKIDISTLKSIPALFGEADVIKSILILPGVKTVGEGTSGFNVRGGKTDQNLILIDQSPIYYPSHFFGNFSAVNSEVIDDAVLYKGSMPVRYGGRISSVLEINTKEGNKEKIQGAGGISPISTRFHIDGPISENSTFLASFRSTYSNWVLNKIAVKELYKSKVSFYDAQVKTNLYINDKNNLIINVYKSNDRFKLQSDTIYNYDNVIAALHWRHSFSKEFKSESSISYSGFSYEIANEVSESSAFSLTHALNDFRAKQNFDYLINPDLSLSYGAEAIFYNVNPGKRIVPETSDVIPRVITEENALEFGAYLGAKYSVSQRLKIEGGIRLSGLLAYGDGKIYNYAPDMSYSFDNIIDTSFTDKPEAKYFHPEFRISGNYFLSRNSSVKLAYNRTAQYIHIISNTTAISPTDTWKLSDKYMLPQTGHQVSAGYFRNFMGGKIESSLEAFYKRINNIKEYKSGAELLLNDHMETEIINGLGQSYGVEFSMEKKGGRIFGRINYTYARTFIKSQSDYEEETINGGEYFPANFDQPHCLTVLSNFKPSRRLVFSATVNYSTGRPITYPVAQYKLGDQIFLHYSDRNKYRIPDYFRVDLALTVDGNLKLKKLAHSTFTFSLYNVTARKNAYSVYFRSEGSKFEAYKLSIFATVIPTVTYNFRF